MAAGDVNFDGYADVIVGAGPGGGPNEVVVSGRDGALLYDFMAFGIGFAGGITVGAADVDGDGRADIIVGAGPGGGPSVSVFSGADGRLLRSWMAFDLAFAGGVQVAGGDLGGDGLGLVIVGAGGGPNVSVFSGTDTSFYQSFMAYDPSPTAGVSVGYAKAGDVRAAGLTGLGADGSGQKKAFDGLTLEAVDDFFALVSGLSGAYFAVGGQ